MIAVNTVISAIGMDSISDDPRDFQYLNTDNPSDETRDTYSAKPVCEAPLATRPIAGIIVPNVPSVSTPKTPIRIRARLTLDASIRRITLFMIGSASPSDFIAKANALA